jgi:hypothetical protein
MVGVVTVALWVGLDLVPRSSSVPALTSHTLLAYPLVDATS